MQRIIAEDENGVLSIVIAPLEKGGRGSGNFGHAGRPGNIGGSSAGGGGIGGALGNLSEGEDVTVQAAAAAQLLAGIQASITDALSKGEKAPSYDLCQVSVPGTNLFCEVNKDVPRNQMPQFSTNKPVAGSTADGLERSESGWVDGTENFKAYLAAQGIDIKSAEMPASNLKATQNQLDGAKIVSMINNASFNPMGKPIFVSSDGYVIDGHHRWAAQIGRDLLDGALGDLNLNVTVVDKPIMEILEIANQWAVDFGFPQEGIR